VWVCVGFVMCVCVNVWIKDYLPTCGLWTADANSHMPCPAHAALCRGIEMSRSERHGRGMKAALCKSNRKDNQTP
jgi:hypothetical protein